MYIVYKVNMYIMGTYYYKKLYKHFNGNMYYNETLKQ